MLLLTACGTAAPEATDSPDGENSAPAGILSSFSTTDIEGNAVDESLFSDYKLTMVNVWATYCGPCISEMPDLGTLAEEYADKGFQIVGLVSDVLDSDGNLDSAQIDKAKEIVASTGANYTHIVPGEGTYGCSHRSTPCPRHCSLTARGGRLVQPTCPPKALRPGRRSWTPCWRKPEHEPPSERHHRSIDRSSRSRPAAAWPAYGRGRDRTAQGCEYLPGVHRPWLSGWANT